MQSALEEIGIDSESLDRFKKNVDSGKIALIDTHDASATAHRQWSGTSKERRWWMQERLDSLRCRVKLVFIEVIVTDPEVIRSFLLQGHQNSISTEEVAPGDGGAAGAAGAAGADALPLAKPATPLAQDLSGLEREDIYYRPGVAPGR